MHNRSRYLAVICCFHLVSLGALWEKELTVEHETTQPAYRATVTVGQANVHHKLHRRRGLRQYPSNHANCYNRYITAKMSRMLICTTVLITFVLCILSISICCLKLTITDHIGLRV